MGLVTGAVLTTFMGIAGAFGNVSSGSLTLSYFPTMDNCKDAVVQFIDDNQQAESPWHVSIPSNIKDTWYARTLRRNGNIVTLSCKPQG